MRLQGADELVKPVSTKTGIFRRKHRLRLDGPVSDDRLPPTAKILDQRHVPGRCRRATLEHFPETSCVFGSIITVARSHAVRYARAP